MKRLAYALLAAAIVLPTPASAAAVPAPIIKPNYPIAATTRAGSHDFDFEFGTWRTHYRLLKRRLVGDREWYDCYGTSFVRPFWGGDGNLEDGDLICPKRHVGGMTLRMYDAHTHQWTLWWGTRALGVSPPPQIGHFNADGLGNFYSYDSWQGKPIITRFQWTRVNGNPHFEQAFSTDHGKTWETNWTTGYERVSASTPGVWNANDPADAGAHGFDFLLGTWKTHYLRLRHPLTGGREWYACEGSSVVRPFWGGSANLEDGDLRCPTQYARSVTLRLYDAATHRWLLYWGTQKIGLAPGLPQAGRFNANGVGDFFAPDTVEGKRVIVRYRWFVRRENPRFEEAFSVDDGKTWLTVWTTDYVRG